MAEIAPLRALRFDLGRVKDAASVLAPPYDVIGEAARAALEAGSEHNVVRLDLPRGEGEDKYAGARRLLDAWVAAGVLREDPRPAIYRYEQTFDDPRAAGRRLVRKGFIARLRLTPFSDRVVLPHEHTLSGPKLDRRKLIQATAAQFSQVFMLYRDQAGKTDRLFAASEAAPADVDAVTADGCRHRLWVVTDPDLIAQVTALLGPKQLMIADGHHRYETMVGLRDECRSPAAAAGASDWDWGAVFLARAEDPGLLVLPTHRLVRNLPPDVLAALPARAAPWFEISVGDERDAAAIEARLGQAGDRVTFAWRATGSATTTWLRLRADADLSALGPAVLCDLDVTVLHGLLLEPLFGIDGAVMAAGNCLSYTHDAQVALAEIAAGRVQGGFFMNPTRVDQVLAACEAGFVLPQKSTYFQPKLATGLVIARLAPDQVPARVD
jgi:uncharacterized protein (DUF1015 family)